MQVNLNESGNLINCPVENKDPKQCLVCPNCLSKRGFYGSFNFIICKGQKLEKEMVIEIEGGIAIQKPVYTVIV